MSASQTPAESSATQSDSAEISNDIEITADTADSDIAIEAATPSIDLQNLKMQGMIGKLFKNLEMHQAKNNLVLTNLVLVLVKLKSFPLIFS